jgi:hypothetical protein
MCPFIDDFWQHEVETANANNTFFDFTDPITVLQRLIRDDIDEFHPLFNNNNIGDIAADYTPANFIGTAAGGLYVLQPAALAAYNGALPQHVNTLQHMLFDFANTAQVRFAGVNGVFEIPTGAQNVGWDAERLVITTMQQNALGNGVFAPAGGNDYTLFNTQADGQPWVADGVQAMANLLYKFKRRYYRPVFDLVESLVDDPRVTILSVDYDEAVIEPGRVFDVRQGRLSDVTLKENLLTVGGLSHFIPERVYKSYFDYPPLIQDFDLSLKQTNLVKYREFSRDVSDCVLELTGKSEFTIHTKTGNSFNQEDKSLQTVLWDVPKIVRYTKDFAIEASGRYKIPFETSDGRPTKVFVYIERVSPAGIAFDDNQPCVAGLELLRLNQSISSIRELDEYEVYDCTRRNAAIRCDLESLRKKTGGALFSLEDVCDWADFDIFGARDTFKGTFMINEADVRSLDTRVPETLTTGERAVVSALERRINVLFIYEQHCLKGQAGTLRFWFKPETYSELQSMAAPFYTS